jgi:hypothetical protein
LCFANANPAAIHDITSTARPEPYASGLLRPYNSSIAAITTP